MDSRAHVHRAPDVLKAKPRTAGKAATRRRNWGIALPLGLMVVAAVVFGILGILNAGTIGEQAVQGAQLGTPFYGF